MKNKNFKVFFKYIYFNLQVRLQFKSLHMDGEKRIIQKYFYIYIRVNIWHQSDTTTIYHIVTKI